MHVSGWTNCCGYPCKIALHPRGHFSSGNPTTILSHLNTWARASDSLLDAAGTAMLSKAWAPFLGPSLRKPIPGHSALLPQAPSSFSGLLHYHTGWLLAPVSSILDSGIWTTVVTPLAIRVGGASVLSLLELKRVN